jgi:hypothetical protein
MTEGQGSWDRTIEKGQLRWDNCGRTSMTVKLGLDIWDMALDITPERTAQRCQSGQVNLDRSARTGQRGRDVRT